MSDQSKLSDERKAFEAWFSESGRYPQAVEREGNGYKLMSAHSAWTAWQAAWRALSAQEAQPAEPMSPDVADKIGAAIVALNSARARLEGRSSRPALEPVKHALDALLAVYENRIVPQPAEQAAQPVAVEPVAWQERQEVRPGVFGEWYYTPTGWSMTRPMEIESGGIRYQFRPLYAAPLPQAGEVERAVAEERELAVRVLADVLETSGANKLHQNREEDARTLLRLARETPNVRGEA